MTWNPADDPDWRERMDALPGRTRFTASWASSENRHSLDGSLDLVALGTERLEVWWPKVSDVGWIGGRDLSPAIEDAIIRTGLAAKIVRGRHDPHWWFLRKVPTREEIASSCSHVVCGIEGSGTEWLSRVVASHPAVRGCWHQSYPREWPGSPYWPLGEIWPAMDVPVIVISRDRTCSERSRRNRGFATMHPDHMDRSVAIREMLRDLRPWQGLVSFCSYEALMDLGKPYLGAILFRAGLQPVEEISFDPSDGNEKYWRCD